jgi:dCMP deaminase
MDKMTDFIRPSWNEIMLAIAHEISKRSTCLRAISTYGGIGAVLVENETNRILGVGYCGSLPRQPHCTEVGCLLLEEVGKGCLRTIHAEVNAILFSKQSENSKTLYTTVSPCLKCLQVAISVGVNRVIFSKLYRETDTQVELCKQTNVDWIHLK